MKLTDLTIPNDSGIAVDLFWRDESRHVWTTTTVAPADIWSIQ